MIKYESSAAEKLKLGHHVSTLAQTQIPEVLTISETATTLRCSRAHVQNLLAGKVPLVSPLPHITLGRRKLIRRESLMRWMEKAETAYE